MENEFDDAQFQVPAINQATLADLLAEENRTQIHLLGEWTKDLDYAGYLRATYGDWFDETTLFRFRESFDPSQLEGVGPLCGLSLIGCTFTSANWSALAHHRHSLLGLCLDVKEEGRKQLAEQLHCLTKLETLVVKGEYEGPVSTAKLADDLHHLSRLTTLALRGTVLGSKAIAKLATKLRHLTRLKTLDLKGNAMYYKGAARLAEQLHHLRDLTDLSLGCNAIGPKGAAKLAEQFRNLNRLSELDLSQNNLGAEGATIIADHLPQLRQLTGLDLGCNAIGNEGASKLAKQLHHLTSLNYLDLRDNAIYDEGAATLAEHLPHLEQLRTLVLFMNGFGDKGIQILASAYERGLLAHLRTLYASFNDIKCIDGTILNTDDARLIFEAVSHGVFLPHARVMLVGMGGVGKSLLARRTFLDRVQHEGPHEETHDILVLRPEECRWMPRIEAERDEPQVQTWVWDFAGQLVTHGVHESFLEDEGRDEGRTVYVVVLAADREPGQESRKHEGNRLRYWLQMLRYTVGDVAPVIIVITRNDKWEASYGPRPVDSPLAWPELTPARALKDVGLDEFSNRLKVSVVNVVTDFSACDKTYPIREGLQRVIQDAVAQLGVVKEKRVPVKFVPLKNLIDDRLLTRTMIARSQFDDWCAELKIDEDTVRDGFLRTLHRMGSVIYWGQTNAGRVHLPRRDDHQGEDHWPTRTRRAPPSGLQTYLLNPKWFKNCVYSITKASEDLIRGKPRVWLTPADIDAIVTQASAGLRRWSAAHPVEGSVIRDALRFIGVCWEDEASGDFLFPRGLPEQHWTEYLAWGGYRLTWDFLPEHCVAKLLVRLHKDGLVVSPKKGIYVHDRNGALIAYPADSENHALVSAVPEEGYVDVRYSKATELDQRQSILQHVLTILRAKELQGRPPVISEIAAENTRVQQPPIPTTDLPPAAKTEPELSGMNPVAQRPADEPPRSPAAKEWKGTLLVNAVAKERDPSLAQLKRFYRIGYCIRTRGPQSQIDIADKLCLSEDQVSHTISNITKLLIKRYGLSSWSELVRRDDLGAAKSKLSELGDELMAWIEWKYPDIAAEVRKNS
jgi:Ran GTPase-activating protein (RanGAP) involved in mRNA processing and transport